MNKRLVVLTSIIAILAVIIVIVLPSQNIPGFNFDRDVEVIDEKCSAECSRYNFLDFDEDGICDNTPDFCFINECKSGFKCPDTLECVWGTITC
ncbi:MAG: hypothetical protein PHW96_02080 [Candidatus Nanoarchaeia archaeon]|nr:hypothetical protein [Candidatus Nanoarchaeia archaeon]